LKAKALSEEILSGEYQKVLNGTLNDSIAVEKKRIFSSKIVTEFISKIPKEVTGITIV
jgi:hypothetical protein